MSRLFSRRPSRATPFLPQNDPHSAYSSLLDSIDPHQIPPHRRTQSSPAARALGLAPSSQERESARPWLGALEGRPSWTGERPPSKKLVKDPSGSARPSFSVEISDSEGEKEKGAIRRSFARLRELYRWGGK